MLKHISQITVCNLKILELRKLPSLRHLWDNRHPRETFAFQNLHFLHISECHSLRYLFSPSMVSGIQQLKILIVTECRMMETIVGSENRGEENTTEAIVFHHLQKLTVKCLPILTSFYSGEGALLNKKVRVVILCSLAFELQRTKIGFFMLRNSFSLVSHKQT